MKNSIDFTKIKMFPAAGRKNLVTIEDILVPPRFKDREIRPPESWKQTEELAELVSRIQEAKERGKPIVWSLGGHVIKCGLSRYLIALMKNGFINHVAIGTDFIHQHPVVDFAAIGGTSGVDFKRYCKTISRLGGKGFNFCLDHRISIPFLYNRLK